MKKKLLWAGVILSVMVAGCAEKPLPMRKTYLYCQVDTLWQSLPSYQVTSNRLFPYSKLAPFGDYAEAAYSDGIALIELEINKPTTVSVMPVSYTHLDVYKRQAPNPASSSIVQTASWCMADVCSDHTGKFPA